MIISLKELVIMMNYYNINPAKNLLFSHFVQSHFQN